MSDTLTEVVETLYYVDAFCDEVMPCEPTLEAWAHWLQFGGDVEDGEAPTRHPVLSDGETVTLTCLELFADLHFGNGTLDRQPPVGANFFAVRFGPRAGWDPDTITSDVQTVLQNCVEADDEAFIAVGRYSEKRRARFRLAATIPVLLLEPHEP